VDVERALVTTRRARRCRSVAVGVDGSPESLAATRFAVELAEARSLDLLLVHAYEWPSLDVPMDAGLVEECLQTAEKLVSEFAAELSLPSPMRVETLIRPELPSVLLQSVARSAPFWSLVRTMSAGVSASCSVRLLTGRPAGGLPRVRCAGSLAGNKDGDVSLGRGGYRRARRTAADISHGLPRGAASRHRRACAAASRYGTPADRLREQDAWLHDALAQWQQRYPRVPSQTQIVDGGPDASLVRWSKSAALIVPGRRHRFGWGSVDTCRPAPRGEADSLPAAQRPVSGHAHVAPEPAVPGAA
jgi:nucleotide-binding universal stress UspA family protein